MKKLLLSLAACAAMLSASASDTWQLGPYEYGADTLFHVTSGPGITTTGVRLSSANGANKTNIFYSTIDLTNPNLELRGVMAKDGGNTVESVQSMGNRKNNEGKGHYVAGVNGDFFNMGGSTIFTIGHSIVDGNLFNVATDAGWQQNATYAKVEGAKDITIVDGITASKYMTFPNGVNYTYHVNDTRWADYLVIYTDAQESTNTNIWGCECTLALVEGSLEQNNAVFEVTSPWEGNCDGSQCGNMTIPKGGYVLSGVGSTILGLMHQLKVGDRLPLGTSVKYNGKEINPRQAVGGCSYIVINGKIAPDKYFSENIIDHFTSNQARTVIGYNEDRTKLIILVADKYASYAKSNDEVKVTDPDKLSYGTSTGMVLQRMGHIMLHLGCYTAMNFDGGGSSQLYNEKRGVVNVPYGDTYLRPVANGFFAVVNTPEEDNEIAYIEVRQKNVNVAEGETFVPTVYGYNKYGVLVDPDVKGFTLGVASELGTSTNGSRAGEVSFTANDKKGSTIAVIELPAASTDAAPIKCGVRINTNGGGEYVTSGGDDLPIMVAPNYVADEPMGIDKEPIFLAEQWKFCTDEYNDGWDGTAPNWESDNAIKAKSCPRFATARNGRFYTVDMKTMSIAEITPEGKIVPLFKLPSLEGRVINGIADYYGTAISTDDAGNFLVGHLFTKTDTYRIWTVYDPKTGKAKHFDIELPEGEGSNGRIDNIGRVVGDLTKEAYAYVAPKATNSTATNKVLILAFKGAGDVDGVTCTPTMSTGLYMAGSGNTMSTCQPKYATVAEMAGKDLNETFYWYSKAAGLDQWNQDLFCFANGTYSPNYCNDWNNWSRLNGFDTFLLGGKRYFVVHYSDSAADNSGQHIIVMDENSNRVAEWTGSEYTSTAGYNSITAVPVGSNQVNIYVYNCDGKHIGGALLTLTLGGEYEAYEAADITPEGYNFDNYADGDSFKLTATESNGGWSAPAGLYRANPETIQQNGHLTVYLDRGVQQAYNTQSYVDETVQPAYVVRKVNDYIGNALAITQPWSPGASRYGWPSIGSKGSQTQLNFYVPAEKIASDKDKRHYVRVRLVYEILLRGCHYTMGGSKLLNSIYSSHENNWVVPENDHLLGTRLGETGINFAQWVDETGLPEDIPAVPVVRVPDADENDAWDPGHNPAGTDANGYPAYVINDQRYRVYEFDTYIDNPSYATVSVQFNIIPQWLTTFIKEIKFTDLGTDEAAANLLRRRSLGWTYYNASTTGIEDITPDANVEGSDAPAVYYNLQGVQVVNPANGIYIVRRGNQVTKEYIR